MEVNIIYNEDGKEPIGWEMRPQTQKDHEIIATIRDLQFFGLDNDVIKYNGIQLLDPKKGKVAGNIMNISWVKRKKNINF